MTPPSLQPGQPHLELLPQELRHDIVEYAILASETSDFESDRRLGGYRVPVTPTGRPRRLDHPLTHASSTLCKDALEVQWRIAIFSFEQIDALLAFCRKFKTKLTDPRLPRMAYRIEVFGLARKDTSLERVLRGSRPYIETAQVSRAIPESIDLWFRALSYIPRRPSIILNFQYIFRDFQAIQNASKQHRTHSYNPIVTFDRFLPNSAHIVKYEDHSIAPAPPENLVTFDGNGWGKRATWAAVHDKTIPSPPTNARVRRQLRASGTTGFV